MAEVFDHGVVYLISIQQAIALWSTAVSATPSTGGRPNDRPREHNCANTLEIPASAPTITSITRVSRVMTDREMHEPVPIETSLVIYVFPAISFCRNIIEQSWR